jgi:hypothetical protein
MYLARWLIDAGRRLTFRFGRQSGLSNDPFNTACNYLACGYRYVKVVCWPKMVSIRACMHFCVPKPAILTHRLGQVEK